MATDLFGNEIVERRFGVLAIKPKYASAILRFEKPKRVEFRRKFPEWDSNKQGYLYLFLYASAPVKEIVGLIRVLRVVKTDPHSAWALYRDVGDISESDFFTYFKGSKEACCLLISAAQPISRYLREAMQEHNVLKDFRPPQNFIYLPTTFNAKGGIIV